MRKNLICLLFLIVLFYVPVFSQIGKTGSDFKAFQQTLSATKVDFIFPKDFQEIKALHNADFDVDYALDLPKANFQVWYLVKNLQNTQAKSKLLNDVAKPASTHPDSVFSTASLSAILQLCGADNYIAKDLPPTVLQLFHANKGRSYQLNLYNKQETNHLKYGLLISLQKSGTGCILMLFLGNENGLSFYKKVNKAYYSVRFK